MNVSKIDIIAECEVFFLGLQIEKWPLSRPLGHCLYAIDQQASLLFFAVHKFTFAANLL